MNPRISVIMTPYLREKQLAITLPTIIGADEIIIEPDTRDHSQQAWMNPAPILNKAISRAKGDVLIIQNPEVLHAQKNVVEELSKVPEGEAWFASCRALDPEGKEADWYCHGLYKPRPLFFCGAIRRHKMFPFPECFTGYGFEDILWADQAKEKGIKFVWRDDLLTKHQWHPPFTGNSNMRAVYEEMKNTP